MHTFPLNSGDVEKTHPHSTPPKEKDAMTSGCLDRKEVRGAIWGVHSTTDRPASGYTGRLFLAFGGPVCADRISNCPLDRMYQCNKKSTIDNKNETRQLYFNYICLVKIAAQIIFQSKTVCTRSC